MQLERYNVATKLRYETKRNLMKTKLCATVLLVVLPYSDNKQIVHFYQDPMVRTLFESYTSDYQL